jgi:two-component system chemotaxis response regulator CheY
MRVLVVDDSSTMRRILINCLAKMQITDVSQAGDGAEALTVLGAHGPFDLMLTDWNMPNVGGLDLLKAVKAEPKYATMPVIVVTTEAEKDRIVEAIKCGAANYIVKPFTPETLQEKLRPHIKAA